MITIRLTKFRKNHIDDHETYTLSIEHTINLLFKMGSLQNTIKLGASFFIQVSQIARYGGSDIRNIILVMDKD